MVQDKTAFTDLLLERLRARVASPATPDLAIAHWRIVVNDATSTEAGLKDNRPGGPYDAPNTVSAIRGEAYIGWADGKVSSGVIDRTSLDGLDEDLVLWRTAAYADAWAPGVVGAVDVPAIPLWDDAAAALVDTDQGPMFAALERFRLELPAYEARLVSGSYTAAVSRRRIVTSAGLDHTSRGTSVAVGASVDMRAHDYLSLRRPPTDAELDGLIVRIGESNRALRRDATLRTGRQRVILWPSVAEAMINKFLIANLDGSRVLNGGGAFTLAQFQAREQVFHEGFDFGVEPTRPLSPGSYEVSSEGVPAARINYVEGGRLLTPLLDLKHAKKAGMAATPLPRGSSSFWLPAPAGGVDEAIAALDHGLIVHGLLGLHTQDSARGSFSVTVGQGLVVENGVVMGRAKAIIAGNFFEALAEPTTFLSVPGKEGLALAIDCEVLPG